MHDLIFHSFIKFTLGENEKWGKANKNQMLKLTTLLLFSNWLFGSFVTSFSPPPHRKGGLLLSLGISAYRKTLPYPFLTDGSDLTHLIESLQDQSMATKGAGEKTKPKQNNKQQQQQ